MQTFGFHLSGISIKLVTVFTMLKFIPIYFKLLIGNIRKIVKKVLRLVYCS